MKIRSKFRHGLAITTVIVSAIAIVASSARAEISKRDAQALSGAELIYIATVRKDGNQSTAAPVWFTLSADTDQILIQTGPKTWKAKRIKRGSPVLVWIGEADGPAFIGNAEITNEAATINKILTDFHEKYWQNRVLKMGPSREGFENGERIAIRIAPVRDLPTGFAPAPGTRPPSLEGAK
jgi:general stress protein 26